MSLQNEISRELDPSEIESSGEIKKIRGRGTPENPKNRFEVIEYSPDPSDSSQDEISPSPQTICYRDSSKTILAKNDSPDVGFDFSLNPYRGCEHGCIYCYARPTHEYLGLSSGLDFETKIFVKDNAPILLRQEMSKPGFQPCILSLSGVTDPYQPIERHFKLTRRCLEVLNEFKNPVGIITKNHLVTRDSDILSEMAREKTALVFVSITTLDKNLSRIMEPRASPPLSRLKTIEELTQAGIPVGVNVAPIIPGLTDHEIPSIIKEAVNAGAKMAGYTLIRLPYSLSFLFETWLETHMPDRKDKILNRIRSIRGGKLYKSEFHTRMKGEGIFAEQIRGLFQTACKKYGIEKTGSYLSTSSFIRQKTSKSNQLSLF